MNELQTLRSEEQIDDHIDMSTNSIEMPFEFISSCHLNQFEGLKEEEQVEGVVHVEKESYFDDEPIYLNELFRDDLIAYTSCVAI